ncbi:MAG: TetR/AcrR family transcriptional regulator [Acidobacteriota bacterium]|nr:TetR/AcrR family transcriptional regulator [Acidobacteriota bacterium]
MRAIAVREDIRDLILDAADRLLERYGYRKMTMDDLAQEVGIGKGTIYLHFSGKEEVALCRIDRVIERLKEQLWVIARSGRPPAECVRQMLLLRVLYRFDNVQRYRESLSEIFATIRPALFARRERHFDEEARIFAEVLKEGRRAGVFVFKDALVIAHTLLLATNSLLPYSLSPRELGKREFVEEQTARIADILLKGLLRR